MSPLDSFEAEMAAAEAWAQGHGIKRVRSASDGDESDAFEADTPALADHHYNSKDTDGSCSSSSSSSSSCSSSAASTAPASTPLSFGSNYGDAKLFPF